MLHPDQFRVNEAWIGFGLNDVPISTEKDGHFNLVALMDAASCFILSTALVPVGDAGLTKLDAKRLLKEGQAHKQQLPATLYMSDHQPAKHLIAEAERQGITVVSVPDDQLSIFVGEAREGFRERFGGGRAQ